eukprot:gene16952-18659_t
MDTTENKTLSDVIIVDKHHTKKVKTILESCGIFNKKFRIQQIDKDKFAIPYSKDKLNNLVEANYLGDIDYITSETLMPHSKAHLISLKTIQRSLCEDILDEYYRQTGKSLEAEYLCDIPTSWHTYGDMLVLQRDSMQNSIWKTMPNIWKVFCKAFNVKRIARHNVIIDDQFRSSNVELLHGDDGWVRRKDNDIIYEYDITKCMFSDGNITEKIRVGNMDCASEVIVDLFAGIGYFVLPYLVHAKAALVYACEWNSMAVEALIHNLNINGVRDRCIVLQGDNRRVAPKGIADRVNLGLIPSSESSWSTACACLKPRSGGWLHIHANVNSLEKCVKGESNCSSGDSHQSYIGEHPACSETRLPSELYNKEAGAEGKVTCDVCSNIAGDVCDEKPGTKRSSGLCEIFQEDKDAEEIKTSKTIERNNSAKNRRDYWKKWAEHKALTIRGLLEKIHKNDNVDRGWRCNVKHIEHVKSYAPHIDHIVVDMECRPTEIAHSDA